VQRWDLNPGLAHGINAREDGRGRRAMMLRKLKLHTKTCENFLELKFVARVIFSSPTLT
jgi:hypothetical protein